MGRNFVIAVSDNEIIMMHFKILAKTYPGILRYLQVLGG